MGRIGGIALRTAGMVAIWAALGAPQGAEAAVGDCLDNQWRMCWGDCPEEHTDQGECTTRIEQTPPNRWCCCSDYYDPFGSGETTPAPPPDSDRDCADVGPAQEPGDDTTTEDDVKDPPPPWAISAAVAKTANPKRTDAALGGVRDNILVKNERTKKYVELVAKFSDEIDQILENNPRLVERTASMLQENLPLVMQLAKGQEITVEREKIRQASALLDRYAAADGASKELKRAIANVQEDLKNRRLLQELGVRVAK